MTPGLWHAREYVVYDADDHQIASTNYAPRSYPECRADAADDYEYLCKRLVDAGRRVTELHEANARLGEAAMEMQQERDAAQAELENIRARGYGSLYAEELETLGHRPWMHDYSNPRGCWCHRN